MVQLCVMAMVLGVVVLMVVPLPRRRIAAMFSRGFGMGVFGAGLVGLVYTLALPLA